LLVSRANEDLVVSEPWNPTATRIEYFSSKFQEIETIETYNVKTTHVSSTIGPTTC
jgi:hypothetical protein